MAQSAHLHHGLNGQKHVIEKHEGSESGTLINKFEDSLEQVSDAGVSIAGEYLYEYTNVLNGGVKHGGSDRNLLVFDAEFDLETIFGLKGATVFAKYLHVNAEDGGSADAADIQGYTNIESARSLDVLYEFWFEQKIADGKYRIKVGKVDANSEFNYVDAGGNFSNSSAGFSPTIFTLPTYPNPAMSVNVFATLAENDGAAFTLGYGLYDGGAAVDGVETGRRGPSSYFSGDSSNDYFHILQGEQTWDGIFSLGEGRLSGGAWYHTGDFESFSGGSESGTYGFFFNAEQRLTTRGEDSAEGLYAFAQFATADENLSEVSQHLALGLMSEGTLACRTSDSAGIYMTYVNLSDDPYANDGAGFAKDECAIDAFYRFQINEHFAVQPELQYIINPSGSTDVSDALIGGVRFSAAF
ncbi:MAG: carbohydrate porin [Rubritalea sp.]